MLHDRYSRLPLFVRISEMAEKLSSNFYKGSRKKVKTFNKLLMESANFSGDYRIIFKEFFMSDFCKIKLPEKTINGFVNKDIINYEDALIFAYIKGKLEGFLYEGMIKQVIIDEAQDYNFLQYKILRKIFKKPSFTRLGDVNQDINPFYCYDSLEKLQELWKGKYVVLNKTYRSSEEIIEYTNKILNLQHIQAIRKKNHHPVLLKKEQDGKIGEQLLEEIEILKKSSKSIAIITKTDEEAIALYKEIKKKNKEISLLETKTEKFNRDLVIVPSYIAKGLEFDSVILYTLKENSYTEKEKYLYYVACTRAQHQLIIYNQKDN